ncbi:MAG: sugar ABC transporter substrate-binding protein [Phycisphaerales bacterium]|nr:sugar ABC transporter substrate-binding protein [Phycisphaerales bacterium]
MSMKQALLSSLVLAASTLGIAGIASQGDLVANQKARIAEFAKQPKSRAHVAFVSNGVADFWTIAKAGAIAAGKELGCDVTVEFPGGGLSDQKRMLEDLLIRGVDGISVSPIDPKNQVEVLTLIAEKSLLITNDSDAPAAPRLCYIGMDNYIAGRMCGELARDGCKGGEVAIFIGRLEQDNAKRRRQGFIDGLLGRSSDPTRYDEPSKVISESGYTIVGTWTDSFDRAKAKANIEDVMIKHPKLALVTGLFEYNSTLAVEVFKQSGKSGKILIAAFDEGADVIEGIRKGTVLGTVVQDPYGYGHESVKMLHAFTKGDFSMVPSDGILSIPARVIKKDNVDAFWTDLKAKLEAGKAATKV